MTTPPYKAYNKTFRTKFGKEDADFIVKACNTHNQLIDIARRAFVKLPDCKLSKDIESLFIMLNESITPSKNVC